MSILKNKHIVTAAIVAPILALIAWFSLDAFLGEAPHAAKTGQSYSLVEKPNCRYASGQCGLKNGEFELTIHTEEFSDSHMVLVLESVFPLDGVKLALAPNAGDEVSPRDMQPVGDQGLIWSLQASAMDPEQARLLVVASAQGALYYGDAAMKFALPQAGASGQ